MSQYQFTVSRYCSAVVIQALPECKGPCGAGAWVVLGIPDRDPQESICQVVMETVPKSE